jgi:hypothetical protein
MRIAHDFWALALLAIGSARVGAADLSKIDRTIVKEPAYKSKPKYCLLVFGPEAKTRVWLVLDGEVLYVDRNGNGDLTEQGERMEPRKDEWGDPGAPGISQHFFEVADIAGSDGKTKFGTLRILFWGPASHAVHEHKCLIDVGEQRAAYVRFAGRTDAPILHFAGPLTFRSAEPQRFVLGQEPRPLNIKDPANWLQVRVGTPGWGTGGTFVGINGSHDDSRKKNLEAQADIEFPCRDGLTKRISFKLTDT